MALYINYSNPNSGWAPREWYINDAAIKIDFAQDVVLIVADGHELQYIQKRFMGLPMPRMLDAEERSAFPDSSQLRLSRGFPLTVAWFGETAKFIVANL